MVTLQCQYMRASTNRSFRYADESLELSSRALASRFETLDQKCMPFPQLKCRKQVPGRLQKALSWPACWPTRPKVRGRSWQATARHVVHRLPVHCVVIARKTRAAGVVASRPGRVVEADGRFIASGSAPSWLHVEPNRRWRRRVRIDVMVSVKQLWLVVAVLWS
eukprot:1536479-Pleurochrysis_carterae.AAC.9